ncbi:hypothetical protein Pelo_18542 [Pelomyxa schiedti]|nr:hypothetical protein Pelo_18542 [Pelomyxa schiedti]
MQLRSPELLKSLSVVFINRTAETYPLCPGNSLHGVLLAVFQSYKLTMSKAIHSLSMEVLTIKPTNTGDWDYGYELDFMPMDSRVLLVIPTPPPRVFHCKTNSHWVLYHYGAEPEFYVEPALLPPTPPQIGSASSSASSSSSLLKVQQEELGLLEGHVISLVALSKREPHLALLISQASCWPCQKRRRLGHHPAHRREERGGQQTTLQGDPDTTLVH